MCDSGARHVNHWPAVGKVAIVTLLAAAALMLGVGLYPLAVDDAFITYRFAHNLATGKGFTYNPGQAVLSTTAPLYVLLLTAGAWLGFDLPGFANALSAVALWAGAALLVFLGCRERTLWVGTLAAFLFVVHPLLWMSLGLETAVFLALALAAIFAYRAGHLYRAAVLLALATLVRGDGLILAAVLAAHYALAWVTGKNRQNPETARERDLAAGSRSLPKALGAIGVYAVVMLPLMAWLTWQFGSPLPATLSAKQAQSAMGVTGFYAHTTYLQGLGILARARLAQSPLYLLFVPAVLAGLVAMWSRGRWVGLVVAWGTAHLVGYTLLGVTPYYWYYAPLVPALVCSAGLGVVEGTRWGSRKVDSWGVGVGGLWAAGLLAALLVSDWAMVQALDGPVPRPENLVSKVLPEAKGDVYAEAGRWLREHTPAGALVGVTEVGIMGYHADRPMIDFLGLLEPGVAEALQRGDLYWALLRYQPEYLALTAVSPLYAYDLRADPWFRAAYAPVQTLEDPRFWGSPLTIYERRVPRTPPVELVAGGLPEGATRLDVDFGGQIRLLGAVAAVSEVRPGDVLGLTLYWEALGPVEHDYTVFVHLLGEHDRVIAQRDATPGLGAQPTSRWLSGQVVADPYLLALGEAAYAPDHAMWEVGLYDSMTGQRLQRMDGGDNVRFGAVSIQRSEKPMHLAFGPVALTGYDLDRLALLPGESLRVTLQWQGEGAQQVTAQLVGETGDVVARASGGTDEKVYHLVSGANAVPGAYDLEVLVTDEATGQRLSLLGADGQPQSDRARLTKVRFYP